MHSKSQLFTSMLYVVKCMRATRIFRDIPTFFIRMTQYRAVHLWTQQWKELTHETPLWTCPKSFWCVIAMQRDRESPLGTPKVRAWEDTWMEEMHGWRRWRRMWRGSGCCDSLSPSQWCWKINMVQCLATGGEKQYSSTYTWRRWSLVASTMKLACTTWHQNAGL